MLLYARSCDEAERMLELLQIELEKMGLELNWSKTKILANDISNSNHEDVFFTQIGDNFVEILRSNDCYRILGRDDKLTQQRAQFEIDHRLKLAWSAYHKHRRALVKRKISLKFRLRLFHAVITPVALFGLAKLPLTTSLLKQIDIVQRKMLRSTVGWIRYDAEDWKVTMQRMNGRVDRATRLIRLMPWSYYIGTRQWMFAQHIANSDCGRWPLRTIRWHP